VIPKTSRFSLAATALIACGAPTGLCGCPPPLGIGTLAGVVSRRGEQPVVGALVRLELSLTGCGMTDLHPVGREVAVTGYEGAYRHDVAADIPTDTACIRVTAVDTAGGRRDSTFAVGIRMRLVPSYGSGPPPDSVRVDLSFP
jgi:hypothetical protein